MTLPGLTFSVVVNTIDRARSLDNLLRALEHQSYAGFEVVVVVGPTRDNTLEMLSEYEGRVRVLSCPAANLSQSRNIGLRGARGDIVAFIDDDAIPCRRWLEQLARLFDNSSLDATGGVVFLVHPRSPSVQHRLGLTSSLFEEQLVRSSALEHIVPPGEGCQWVARMTGGNMAFRRQALLDIGGFDEFFVFVAEESDAVLRLVNAGKLVYPAKEAAVYHVPASNRHRDAFSHRARWWLQTRSGIYFAIKNGWSAGDAVGSIVLRCLHLLHGHWKWHGDLQRDGELTTVQLWLLRMREIWGAASGALSGIAGSRRLLELSEDAPPSGSSAPPILEFSNDASSNQPAVDPVTGHRPSLRGTTEPLRVCLLSGNYPPQEVDGIGRLTHLMARGLFELGHTVHVVTRGEREKVTSYEGALVHRITYRLDRYERYLPFGDLYHSLNYSHAVHEKVKRLILNDGIQLVDSPIWQTQGLVTAVSGVIPVAVRLITSYRQIADLKRDRGEAARLAGELEELLLQRATHLLPNTEATLATAQSIYDASLTSERCTVVPYGIVPVPDDAISPFDLDLEHEHDSFTVLYVGRLEQRKGTLDLFHAIPRVLSQVPNARFVLAGQDNSAHDGFQRRTGTDYPTYFARNFGKYLPRVEFMGRVSDEVLDSLYRACDLFVAPSLYESFGLIYLEAMNYAKPVVGCSTGGVPEVVEHGVTGLLVEPESAPSLSEAIVGALRSPETLHEMGLAGRRRLLENFTYTQMADRFARAYRRAIGQDN